MNQAAQIQQASAKSDSGDVRHAEKIIGIHEPTPFLLMILSRLKGTLEGLNAPIYELGEIQR